MMRAARVLTIAGAALAMAIALPARAVPPGEPTDRLAQLETMDIAELYDVRVELASRKAEEWFSTSAAVYVITREEIRRSGLHHVPELLRLVPGVHVVRVNASRWAITARGFNGLFAAKLLVMIDGRSVYTPFFAGVYWDVQDVVVEDIDRIEVVRGPGGTLWGANAVNGVIHVITKKARDTQGVLISGGGGTDIRGVASVRYGGQIGEDFHYRASARFRKHDEFPLADGSDGHDGWRQWRGGFRAEWTPGESDEFTLQGGVYEGDLDETSLAFVSIPVGVAGFTTDSEVAGGHALARWKHTFSPTADATLQVYYDHAKRDELVLLEKLDTIDVDFQHRFGIASWNELTWGLGYRRTSHGDRSSAGVVLNPDHRGDHLYSAFLQDTTRLLEDRLRITLGTKVEHNSFTGWEFQPSARAAWTPVDRFSLWAAASRAIRTPARTDHDIRINTTVIPSFPPGLVSILASQDVESERVYSFEMGARFRPTEHTLLDLALFRNRYDRLLSTRNGAPFAEATPPPAHLVFPQLTENHAEGTSKGIELRGQWKPHDRWTLVATYSYLDMDLRSTRSDARPVVGEGQNPHHQASLRSHLDLPGNLELDVMAWWVSHLRASQANPGSVNVPTYYRLDVRLGWRPASWLELSVSGQNLLDARHPEVWLRRANATPTEVERGFYGTATIRF